MSRFYLFDLPEDLVSNLQPFKLNFVPQEDHISDSDTASDSDASSDADSSDSESTTNSNDESLPQIKSTNLSYTQYQNEPEESMERWQWTHRAHITGTPYVYYTPSPNANSQLIPQNQVLAVYKAWFDADRLISSPVSELQQLNPSGTSCVLMVSSGNFAGAIFEHRKANRKANIANPLADVVVRASKTFHRYTTRRKQGGAQSASDAARGKANSAGSSIRRANERALQEEIKQLLNAWESDLQRCHRIFFRAPGKANKQLIAGYPNAPIALNDKRLVPIPFATAKPTLLECKTAWIQLTQAQTRDPPQMPKLPPLPTTNSSLPTSKSRQRTPEASPVPEKSAEEVISSKIVDFVKRSKLPALKLVLQREANNNFDFALQPTSQFRQTPTPLLLAASLDKPNVVSQLLLWGANPELRAGNRQTLGDIAKPNAKVSQALQISRHALGEARWNWQLARVGPPLTREQIAAQESAAKQAEREEQQRSEAELAKQEHEQRMERLIKQHGSGKLVGGLYEASRGLSAEDLRQVERERRARALEARIAKSSRG